MAIASVVDSFALLIYDSQYVDRKFEAVMTARSGDLLSRYYSLSHETPPVLL